MESLVVQIRPMRKTIYKKLVLNTGGVKNWRLEGVRWPYKARLEWSRSSPGSNLYLQTGFVFNPKIDLGGYRKQNREYEIDLSFGDIVLKFPSEVVLSSTGKASVLVALDVELQEN